MFNFFKKNKWPKLDLDEIRKRSRILVIDDTDFAYLSLFKNDGYTIEKWDDVVDLHKLEKGHYDIILLDIQGVGRAYSTEQGLGILKHLYEVNPSQIVVAYSNADFSLKYQDFFQKADAVLAKGEDYVEFKRTVDKLLMERFSLGFYTKKIEEILTPYVNDTTKIKKISEKSIIQNDPNILKEHLEQYIDNKDIINISLQIVQIAIGIASLCK